MGWDALEITIYIHLDRHGGERQKEADRLHDELLEEIRKIVAQEKYKPLSPDML